MRDISNKALKKWASFQQSHSRGEIEIKTLKPVPKPVPKPKPKRMPIDWPLEYRLSKRIRRKISLDIDIEQDDIDEILDILTRDPFTDLDDLE